MTHDPVDKLLVNLETSLEVYRQLLELAEIKQRHIIANDLPQLQNDLRAEERLLNSAQELNLRRAELHRLSCAALKAEPGAKTLDELCRFVPADLRGRFENARTALNETVRRLREVNRVNVGLINNCIELVEGLISALFDAPEAAAYKRGGERSRAEISACSLDAKA